MEYDDFSYSLCGSEESPNCLTSNDYYSCLPLDFYSFTGTNVEVCGCSEPSILSNIVVLIDGTNHSNHYSWYYWSTSFPKLWYYDLTRYQPLINITYIYYGTNVEYIKRGDPAQFFGAEWTTPDVFIDDETPNLCNAFQAAIDTFDTNDEQNKKKILILLANTTPFIPNNNDLCTNNLSLLNDIDIYAIKSSPNVNLSIIEQYVELDECIDVFEEYDPNWATYFDDNSYSFKPNLNAYNYLNLIVSTISDFVCTHSDICKYTYYSTGQSICSFSCVNDDYSCVVDSESLDPYYIIKAYDGSHPLLLTQQQSNDICNQYFNTTLASLHTTMDQQKILSLMKFYNVSDCYIGLHDIHPIFTVNDIEYFEWMDNTINTFNHISSTDNNGCVSISSSGEWIVNDCSDVHSHCFLCNTIDSATLTVSNDKYHVINSVNAKSRHEANQHCIRHYNTHLSTIQSEHDQNDMMNALQTMDDALDHNETSDVWIGDTVFITYDNCIDDAVFNEIWADGSSYNFTLLEYDTILHETCIPTLSPTYNPLVNTTISNTSDAPISPTQEPTYTPTSSPVFEVQKYCSISRDGAWDTTSTDSVLNSFSCNVFDRSEYALRSENYYVFYGNIGKTWLESDAYCLSIFGTKLSTIYDISDQNEIITLRERIKNDSVVYSNKYDMWIGMKLDDGKFSDAEIEWTDGSKSNYSRLNSGCLVILQDAAVNMESNSWMIDSCDDIEYSWSCNNFVPTQRPTVSPTLSPIQKVISSTYLDIVFYIISTHPFETFYIILVLLSLIVSVLAFFHSKNILCCCNCCCDVYYADDARWTAVVVYALQIWDFLSDCSFAYNIQNRMSILFILSSSFILVPWICNICFLFIFRYQHSINTNFETNKWFRDHAYKLVFVTMLCGSANTSINLMNSRIFGLNIFNMGLTKIQLIETTKFKVILNTFLENTPQIAFTSYFLIKTDGITNFAVMSLISSTLSVILAIVVAIIFSIDPMEDEYIEMTLKYNEPLESVGGNTDIETGLLKRFGFHRKIAEAIAYSFSLNTSLVNVDKHKYNIKNKSISLLVSINTTNQKNDEEESAANIGVNTMTDNLINKLESKDATVMLCKILDSIKCSAFSSLFYQINLIPLNKNGQKKLPISKKIKLDPNLMSDLTMFEDSELQMVSSSLLRAGSDPMQSVNMKQRIYDDDDDEDEILNIQALPPRPITDNDDDEIEMVQQNTPLNKQFSSSTHL